jgi:hypothetical protein
VRLGQIEEPTLPREGERVWEDVMTEVLVVEDDDVVFDVVHSMGLVL